MMANQKKTFHVTGADRAIAKGAKKKNTKRAEPMKAQKRDKRILLAVTEDFRDQIKQAAERDNRSVNNYIELAVKEYMQTH